MVASYYYVSTITLLMGQPINHKPTLLFTKKQNIWGDLIALLKKHIFAAFGFFVEFCYLFSGKQNSNSSSVDALRQAL